MVFAFLLDCLVSETAFTVTSLHFALMVNLNDNEDTNMTK
jgi:hypothetical protein